MSPSDAARAAGHSRSANGTEVKQVRSRCRSACWCKSGSINRTEVKQTSSPSRSACCCKSRSTNHTQVKQTAYRRAPAAAHEPCRRDTWDVTRRGRPRMSTSRTDRRQRHVTRCASSQVQPPDPSTTGATGAAPLPAGARNTAIGSPSSNISLMSSTMSRGRSGSSDAPNRLESTSSIRSSRPTSPRRAITRSRNEAKRVRSASVRTSAPATSTNPSRACAVR